MIRGLRPQLVASTIPSRVQQSRALVSSMAPRLSKLPAGTTWRRPRRLAQPSLLSHYTSIPPSQIRAEEEAAIAKKKLEARPGEVTGHSSTRHLFEGGSENSDSGSSGRKPDVQIQNELISDLKTIKETFALHIVPGHSLFLGLSGTIPYFATSLATVYLSWDLNTPLATSSQFLNSLMVSHETAAQWLHLLEGIQVGYGAVIISFLGAIHWGLEYAEKEVKQPRTNFRYGMGVLAPVIAWPSMLMPIQFALISQFVSFVLLYMADGRAKREGWVPVWYGRYRFVLTFIVCSAILVSLVGREKIGADQARLTHLRTRFHKEGHDPADYEKYEEAEKKEKARLKKEKEEAEKEKKAEEAKAKKAEEEKEKEKESRGDADGEGKDEKDEDESKTDSEGADEKKDENDKAEDESEPKDESDQK